MTHTTLETSPDILAYCTQFNAPLSSDCQKIANQTRDIPGAQMLCHHSIIALLKMLIHIHSAKNILEIGTFTGFSALNMAEALPPKGKLTTIELASTSFSCAKEHFATAKHGHKITALNGDAKMIIPTLSGPFDFVFVDADKCAYANYLELIVPKLSATAMMVFDNVLWSGEVMAPKSKQAKALAQFNQRVSHDKRFNHCLLALGDGVMMLYKFCH